MRFLHVVSADSLFVGTPAETSRHMVPSKKIVWRFAESTDPCAKRSPLRQEVAPAPRGRPCAKRVDCRGFRSLRHVESANR
jgi:hypothetical protein